MCITIICTYYILVIPTHTNSSKLLYRQTKPEEIAQNEDSTEGKHLFYHLCVWSLVPTHYTPSITNMPAPSGTCSISIPLSCEYEKYTPIHVKDCTAFIQTQVWKLSTHIL